MRGRQQIYPTVNTSPWFTRVTCLALLLVWLPGVLNAAPSPIMSAEFVYEQAPFPQCHASTIVETKASTLITSFFGGTHEINPDVGIWISRQEGGRWTMPIEVADCGRYTKRDGTVMRHPTWNPVLFQPCDGPLMLFYKVGPSRQTWWGMLITSIDDGRTWSEPRRLPEGIRGPIKNKPIQLADGSILCPSSAESPETGWTVHFERTRDLRRTWELTGPINTKAEFNAIRPRFLKHRDGRLQILARRQENVIATSWSTDEGPTWNKIVSAKLPNPNSGTDAVTLVDGWHVLVHNHKVRKPDGKSGPRSPLNVRFRTTGSFGRMWQCWRRTTCVTVILIRRLSRPPMA